MYRYNETVQKMVRWVESNLRGDPTLLELSKQVGYSPWYCSSMFHQVYGCTLRSYVARRRLTQAAIELRDSRRRILDIALDWGFSGQEALTRAFREEFGLSPAAYRRQPVPIPLTTSRDVFHPWQYSAMYPSQKGDGGMSTKELREARIRTEYIPAHKYIGIWEPRAKGYGDFWSYHDCDQVCGIIESMRDSAHPVVTPHTAGWVYTSGRREYFYGFGVPEDYSGPVPDGFEIRSFPGSYYLVFYHPPFDYMENNGEVMRRVEELAWNYDLNKAPGDPSGISTAEYAGKFQWNEGACQCYQRHYPEGIGYQILRPVRLKGNGE